MTATHPSERFVLPDGRVFDCPSELDAASIWGELSEAGAYDVAVAELDAGDVVVDVGAHVGLTSTYLRDRVPGLTVIAAEPAPTTFACLAENLGRHVPGGVALRTAVGDRIGTVGLTYYPMVSSMSTIVENDEDDRHNVETILHNAGQEPATGAWVYQASRSSAVRVDVPMTTVDRIVADHGIDRIGLLKVDVERAELEVLAGVGAQTWPRIRTVAVEVHDIEGSLGRAVALLGRHGFRVEVEQGGGFQGTSVFVVTARRVGGS